MENHCYYCNVMIAKAPDGIQSKKIHLDHFVPRAMGGEDELFNIVPACQPCNLAKSDQSPGKWAVRCHDEALLAISRISWLIGRDATQKITEAVDEAFEGVGEYFHCPNCGYRFPIWRVYGPVNSLG